MRQKHRVLFLYRAGHVNTGSKIMRCDQLCNFANEFLGDQYEFVTRALPRSKHLGRQRRLVSELAGCSVIFLKRADKVLEPEILHDLRDSVKSMAIDYVDANMYPLPTVAMDAHISASFAGTQALDVLLSDALDGPRNNKTASFTVLHHADPRIQANEVAGISANIGYFGDPKNAYLPEFARRQIPSLDSDEGMPEAFLDEMKKYNLHYCVRQVPKRLKQVTYKPFTKGFNAAASNANVLVNRQVPDAVQFLGDDYPFLVDDLSYEAVQGGFDAVHSAYGTPVWNNALERMAEVKSRVAPAEVSRQLNVVLQAIV